MTIETQIVNGTINQTIVTTEPISAFWLPLALVTITSLIAIITFVYSRKAYHETKRSNELFDKDLKIRLRARCLIKNLEPHFVRLNNGKKLSYDDYINQTNDPNEVKKISYLGYIKNVGLTPCSSAISWSHVSYSEITKQDVIDKGNKQDFKLMVDEEYPISYTQPGDLYRKYLNQTVYVGYHLEYEYETGKKDETGKIFAISKNAIWVYAYW